MRLLFPALPVSFRYQGSHFVAIVIMTVSEALSYDIRGVLNEDHDITLNGSGSRACDINTAGGSATCSCLAGVVIWIQCYQSCLPELFR